MANLTNEQANALAPYADKLERSIAGQSVSLSTPDARKLENIYLEVFGKKISLRSCCGSGRTTGQRLAPLARLYAEAAATAAKAKTAAPAPEPVVMEQVATQVVEPAESGITEPEPAPTATVDTLAAVVNAPAKKRGRPAKAADLQ